MQDIGLRHRLMVILAADVAGYSRLMATDERATIGALDTAREVFRQRIDDHSGRVVDTAGDSVLAVFDTAAGAVDAALAIQQQLAAASIDSPEDRRMRFRIGIHLGDVIEKSDGSVYGNGVNVAARLQALAAPGGISVSEAVRSALSERTARSFDDQGQHSVKNIAEPVHAYRLSIARVIPGRGYRFTAVVADRATNEPKASPLVACSANAQSARIPTNLAAELPPLYGRDGDLDAIRACINVHRLVTIVGAGGVGKTRLAQAVAHGLGGRCPDGVWLVELAPLADAAMLAGSVAHTLGIALNGQHAPSDELVAALEAQHLLLVLDNCEHLIEAVAALARALIDRAPGTSLLVTSQAPLGLPVEQLFRLEPLAVPETLDVARALDYGAVRLFTERVTALDRHFMLDPHNTATVINICRGLDGLPLAIELAAARVPLLGVQGVHERLGERFRMLTSGAPSRPKRHHTLRATLEWSHGLLTNEEQAVFRRLGVFSGGCTIEAAQRIANDAQLDEWAVLELLGRLVDRSLVVADGGDRPRLRLLESVRAYAVEKLVDAGEMRAWQRKHAEYFAAYFDATANALYAGTSIEGQFIQARDVELDNLRKAIEASFGAHGDVQTALRLLVAAAPMCHLLPLQGQVPRWWRALSQRIDPQASARQAALCRYGWIHWGQSVWWSPGDWPDWPQIAASPLDALGDARRQAHALCVQALKVSFTGDFAAAYAALDEAGELEAPDWPAWLRTRRTFFRASFDRETGKAVTGPAVLNEALIELESAGDGDGRWAFLIRTDLAMDGLLRGCIDEAVQRLRALAELGRRQRQDSIGMCPVLASLVLALAEQESLDDACDVALEAAQHLKRSGLWPRWGSTFALLAAKRGHGESAARMIGAVDAHMARSGLRRPQVVQRVRERALLVIAATHAAPQVEAWLAEGAKLDGNAFSRLAIESTR